MLREKEKLVIYETDRCVGGGWGRSEQVWYRRKDRQVRTDRLGQIG